MNLSMIRKKLSLTSSFALLSDTLSLIFYLTDKIITNSTAYLSLNLQMLC